MRKIILLQILIVCLGVNISAQNYKFSKVSKEELVETHNPEDSTANATILYKKHHLRFDYIPSEGFTQIIDVHQRIKIYNKKGFDWATHQVRLYDQNNSVGEQLRSLKGYTYNIVDGKIEEAKLKKDGVFDEKVNKFWRLKKFTMPNIKDGCIIEFKYEIVSPSYRIDDIILQHKIPIKKLDVSITTPQYLRYQKHTNLRANYYPKLVESRLSKNINIPYKDNNGNASYSNFSYSINKVAIHQDNIIALKDEKFVDNINNYRAKLSFELQSVESFSGQIKNYSTSWDKVVSTIYENENFGGQLTKTNYFEDDIDALVSGVSDPMKKMQLIFNYVVSKVKWNGYYGKYVIDGVKKAYKEQNGNVAEINLMLTAMLRYVGLNANPVLVSTKSNGVPLFPTHDGFNYVIAVVEVQNGIILMDATEPLSTANLLPTRVLNWQGRTVRKNGSSTWIDLIPKELSKDIKSISYKIHEDFTAEGKIRTHYTRHNAMDFRKENQNVSKEGYVKKLEDKGIDIEVLDIELKNKKENAKPLTIGYGFKCNDAVENIGDKLYLSPLLFHTVEENPFKDDNRDYPIDFIYPFEDRYNVNIMLPEGYVIEMLPDNLVMKLDQNGLSQFNYIIKENGSYLQIMISFSYNYSILPVQNYLDFKQYYSSYIEKLSEKIVLKKV